MKKTILLVHGLRGNHHGLTSVAKELDALGYETINIDLPGSGTRAELDKKTLMGYAEWMHKHVQKLPHKPYVVAHSMGSIIMSYYISLYPEDVQDKVVFMSPIFRTKIGQGSSTILYTITSGFLHLLPKKTRFKLMKSRKVSFCISHYLTADKTKQKEIDELHYKYSGIFASADSLLADMKISMKKQVTPLQDKEVLYVIGSKDRLTSAKLAARRAVEHDAEFKEIEGVGHLINYEKPAQLAEAVDEFLS